MDSALENRLRAALGSLSWRDGRPTVEQALVHWAQLRCPNASPATLIDLICQLNAYQRVHIVAVIWRIHTIMQERGGLHLASNDYPGSLRPRWTDGHLPRR